jgi:hypothetical protein
MDYISSKIEISTVAIQSLGYFMSASKRKSYGKASLPQPLIDRVKEFVSKNPKFGYTSVSDFVKDATREKLDKYYFSKHIKRR